MAVVEENVSRGGFLNHFPLRKQRIAMGRLLGEFHLIAYNHHGDVAVGNGAQQIHHLPQYGLVAMVVRRRNLLAQRQPTNAPATGRGPGTGCKSAQTLPPSWVGTCRKETVTRLWVGIDPPPVVGTESLAETFTS